MSRRGSNTEMFASTTCGKRSVTATKNWASARWNAPCEESSPALQCPGSSTKKRRGKGVVCASSKASAAKDAPASVLRKPCINFETVATSKFECWCPSCKSGSAMQRKDSCRVSRCFKASLLSRTWKPASDTHWATDCHEEGSPIHNQGMPPLPTKLETSMSSAQRRRSAAF